MRSVKISDLLTNYWLCCGEVGVDERPRRPT
jgi:hypothetical protein